MGTGIMSEVLTLKKEIRECRSEMRKLGIKRISCFNGGSSGESYSYNARMFALETKLKEAVKKASLS